MQALHYSEWFAKHPLEADIWETAYANLPSRFSSYLFAKTIREMGSVARPADVFFITYFLDQGAERESRQRYKKTRPYSEPIETMAQPNSVTLTEAELKLLLKIAKYL